MDDYHIRKLTDGTWIVSCMEQGKEGPGKQIEYSYDTLPDALADIEAGFSDEPKQEESKPEAESTGTMKKIMRGDDE